MAIYRLGSDPGHIAVFGPSPTMERSVVCWAPLVEILGGLAWERRCVQLVDEHAPVCPDHGERLPLSTPPPAADAPTVSTPALEVRPGTPT